MLARFFRSRYCFLISINVIKDAYYVNVLSFQRMIQEVIVAQPADPLEHMINMLHRENDDGR